MNARENITVVDTPERTTPLIQFSFSEPARRRVFLPMRDSGERRLTATPEVSDDQTSVEFHLNDS
jgi:hypothetical protein